MTAALCSEGIGWRQALHSGAAKWLKITALLMGLGMLSGCATPADEQPVDASFKEAVVPASLWAEQVRRDYEKDMETRFGIKPKPTYYGRTQLSWTSSTVGDLVIILGPDLNERGRLTAQEIAELSLSFVDPTVRSVTVEVPGGNEHGFAQRKN